MIWRFVPLTAVVLFIGVVFCWRPWLQLRRYGISGIVLFRSRRQGLRDVSAVALFVVLVGQAATAAAWPSWLAARALHAPGPELWHAGGGVVLLGGLVLLLRAQLALGASWRIGIDEGARPGLMTGGLYRFCRNPIYLAIFLMLVGYALLLPTRLSLILLLVAYLGFRLQTAAEETYLLRTYGDEYREYASRVGRFVPRLGTLR